MKQAKDKLLERNTHVKIADKYGWDTLEGYLGDDLVDGPDEVAKLRKAESCAIKRRVWTRSHLTETTIQGQAQACGMIFFVSTMQMLSDSILTLDTVTHKQYRGIALGFGQDPNQTQDSNFSNLRCASTVSAWVTSPPSVLSSFTKEQAKCRCQRQPSQTRRQIRKSSRQDEQLQDDFVSIASEVLQCKAEFKEKHFKIVNVKGRSSMLIFGKMLLMSVIRI